MHGFQAEDISGRSFFAGNLKMKRLHPGLYYRHQKRSGLWKEVTGCLFGMYLLYCFKMTDEWLGWWWKEVCHGEEAQKEPQTLYRPETCVKRKGKEMILWYSFMHRFSTPWFFDWKWLKMVMEGGWVYEKKAQTKAACQEWQAAFSVSLSMSLDMDAIESGRILLSVYVWPSE